MTTSPNDDAKLIRLAETRLRAAAAGEREARETLTAAEELTLSEIETARDLGITWARIAEVTGLTDTQAQWRIHRDDPSVRELRERERVPETEKKSRRGTRAGQGPGMSISEWARRTGKTRRTVYLWIEAGKLEVTKNALGQNRILSDPEEFMS
jgi:DNA-binding transcriptional MerR regulator